MSKHKKRVSVDQAQKVEQSQAAIANSRKPTLTIDNIPSRFQSIALTRFKWMQWIAFIPLAIVVLAVPMLQNEVPATLSGGTVSKNVLFLIPFCCLLVAWFCWISIRTRRRVDHVDGDVTRFALMEVETLFGDIIVVAICTVATLWQVFVAFH